MKSILRVKLVKSNKERGKNMSELKMFEGQCKYCGSIETILANSQKEANFEVSKNCICNGYEEDTRRKLLVNRVGELCKENALKSFLPIVSNQKHILEELAINVLDGKIDKVTVQLMESKFTIVGGDKIKVTRTSSSQEKMEV